MLQTDEQVLALGYRIRCHEPHYSGCRHKRARTKHEVDDETRATTALISKIRLKKCAKVRSKLTRNPLAAEKRGVANHGIKPCPVVVEHVGKLKWPVERLALPSVSGTIALEHPPGLLSDASQCFA